MLLLDVKPLCFRAACAMPAVALQNFIKVVTDLQRILDDRIAIAVFDSDTPTWRHRRIKEYETKFPAYKGARKERPKTEGYEATMKLYHEQARTVFAGLGIPILWADGWEADDLIASLVRVLDRPTVVSQDKDFHQLFGAAAIWDPLKVTPGGAKGRFLTIDDIRDKWGTTTIRHIPHIQALAGDASDSIPGARSIGPVNAAKLIEQFGSVQQLFQALRMGPCGLSERKRSRLLEDEQAVLLSYDLVLLRDDLDVVPPPMAEWDLDALARIKEWLT